MELKNKKITFVLGGLTKGGAERVVCNLSNHFVKKGYDIDIITLLSNKIEYEIDSKINIINLAPLQRADYKTLIKWIKDLHCYFKQNQERTVISFFVKVNIVTTLSLFGCKNKLVVSERSDPFSDGRSELYNFITKFLYKRSNHVVFQTNKLSRLFPRLGDRRKVIVNPIVIYEEYEKIYPKENLIVSVGRLDDNKNHEILIKAIGEIREKIKGYKIIIYGEGKNRKKLEGLIFLLKLEDMIFLPGNVDNVHECIHKAKIFVLTSNFEGLSNALQEAMSLGLCCISTNCLGAKELLTHGKTGVIIERKDERALKEQILYLLTNEKNLQRYGDAAWEKSRDYAINNIADEWEKIL